MSYSVAHRRLTFTFDAGTSRGVLREKDTWYVRLEKKGKVGIGECSPIWGLSPDQQDGYADKLHRACLLALERGFESLQELADYPSIQMGLEAALSNLQLGEDLVFESDFKTQPIPINGLVWMGSYDEMLERAREKIGAGFDTIKFKIGALNFDEEMRLLSVVRRENPHITIRVDANGAFSVEEMGEVLRTLGRLQIHSIEQPIPAGNWDLMGQLSANSPIGIALDEELIMQTDRKRLLEAIKPQFIVLKPSLLGGFENTMKWIMEARQQGIGWWVTSMLESNVGLNAIAQFTAHCNDGMVHGLGTGALYANNVPSPLVVIDGYLWYDPGSAWQLPKFD